MAIEILDPCFAAQKLVESIAVRDGDDRPPSAELLRQAEAARALLATLDSALEVQVAAYLHNFVYCGWLEVAAVAAVCGPRVGWLCQEANRILSERVLGARNEGSGRGKTRARQRAHNFVAAYCNPELGLLAVAILWGRFRVAQLGTQAQRHQFADEGRHVLSPLLDMMGMQAMREELAAWLWHLHDPAAARLEEVGRQLFQHIQHALAQALPAALPDLQLIARPLLPPVPQGGNDGYESSVRGSSKQLPPIHLSLVVADEEACYRVLYWLHQLFLPVDHSMLDDLHGACMQGTRELVTTALVPFEQQRQRVTFHIGTPEMEEINRWGVAAVYARTRVQVNLPHTWWHTHAESYAQIASAPLGSLPETLYVFSPQGQLFRFHRGCTPVDYAYHVHTELADQCQRFYINDDVAEPTTPLHHLDVVALEHDPRAPGPTQVWLNAAHTSRARNHIERFLKRRGLGVDQGQKILDQRLRALETHYNFNVSPHRVTQATVKAMRQFKLSRIEELLSEIAAGRIVADRILHDLFAEEIIRQILLPRASGVRAHQLQLAQCCRPRLGDDIVGLPTRRQGEITRLRVHCATCARVAPHGEQMPLKWRLQPSLKLLAQLELTAHDQDELLGDALAQIYAHVPRATLRKVEAVADHGVARFRFNVEVESQDVVEQIVCALHELAGHHIVEVRQMRLPPSELEALAQLSNSVNPYSRLPVHEQAMFFGRSQELLQIYEWLRAGAGNIWLMGQKRVGKTSLLLHLKNYYLKDRGFVLAFVDFQLLGNLATSNIFFEVANAVYNELQADPRIGELGAPLPGVFAHQPPVQLINYLRSIRSRLGANRLVLLLDEFSRTTDAHLLGDLDRSFFDGWRGLLQATAPEISYITVFQQQTYAALSHQAQHAQHVIDDPSWHLMELGEKLVLKQLGSQDVRRLIEWPMRNFLEYTPECVAHVARLTGGSPFLTQAFCFKLAAHMAHNDRRQVEAADLETVRQEFMAPTESVFAHFLDVMRGSGHQVTQQLACLADGGRVVTWEEISATLPNYPADKLRRTLAALTAGDILCQPAPEQWQFASLLFQQWLELNAV